MKTPMTLLFAIVLIAIANSAHSQVIVNGQDLNESVEVFELYAFKKPFSTKESYFVNYGQKKFRLHYYDHKTQAICDADGNKFHKGEWLQLISHLKKNGWAKLDEREEKLGNNVGRVITFGK